MKLFLALTFLIVLSYPLPLKAEIDSAALQKLMTDNSLSYEEKKQKFFDILIEQDPSIKSALANPIVKKQMAVQFDQMYSMMAMASAFGGNEKNEDGAKDPEPVAQPSPDRTRDEEIARLLALKKEDERRMDEMANDLSRNPFASSAKPELQKNLPDIVINDSSLKLFTFRRKGIYTVFPHLQAVENNGRAAEEYCLRLNVNGYDDWRLLDNSEPYRLIDKEHPYGFYIEEKVDSAMRLAYLDIAGTLGEVVHGASLQQKDGGSGTYVALRGKDRLKWESNDIIFPICIADGAISFTDTEIVDNPSAVEGLYLGMKVPMNSYGEVSLNWVQNVWPDYGNNNRAPTKGKLPIKDFRRRGWLSLYMAATGRNSIEPLIGKKQKHGFVPTETANDLIEEYIEKSGLTMYTIALTEGIQGRRANRNNTEYVEMRINFVLNKESEIVYLNIEKKFNDYEKYAALDSNLLMNAFNSKFGEPRWHNNYPDYYDDIRQSIGWHVLDYSEYDFTLNGFQKRTIESSRIKPKHPRNIGDRLGMLFLKIFSDASDINTVTISPRKSYIYTAYSFEPFKVHFYDGLIDYIKNQLLSDIKKEKKEATRGFSL